MNKRKRVKYLQKSSNESINVGGYVVCLDKVDSEGNYRQGRKGGSAKKEPRLLLLKVEEGMLMVWLLVLEHPGQATNCNVLIGGDGCSVDVLGKGMYSRLHKIIQLIYNHTALFGIQSTKVRHQWFVKWNLKPLIRKKGDLSFNMLDGQVPNLIGMVDFDTVCSENLKEICTRIILKDSYCCLQKGTAENQNKGKILNR
ncbi:hypothetical protein M8C21_002168 [Ambrosia artemisiifolia]|uniref:Uncharacterized protein n=1 Tax=Ambrosia artemisiifolia TaxID=4212 RepID=A0AAD5G1E5_AMBAR|nr:hypothetical protein M8C21_002168 [Ambrosia artemisiifolia]